MKMLTGKCSLIFKTHLLLQIQLNVLGSACLSACLSTSLKTITSQFMREAKESSTHGGAWRGWLGEGEERQQSQSKSRWKKQQIPALFPWKSREEPAGFQCRSPPGPSGAVVVLRRAPNVTQEEPATRCSLLRVTEGLLLSHNPEILSFPLFLAEQFAGRERRRKGWLNVYRSHITGEAVHIFY